MNNSLDSKFIAYLNAKHIPFAKDADGDINFCHKGQQLCYICNYKDDIPYFRLIQFGVDRVKKEEKLCLKACNGVTRRLKVLKAYIGSQNTVEFTVELFIPLGVHHIEVLFDRIISIFPDAKSEYKKIKDQIKKEDEENGSLDDEDLMLDLDDSDLDEILSENGGLPEEPDPEGIDLQTFCQLVNGGTSE